MLFISNRGTFSDNPYQSRCYNYFGANGPINRSYFVPFDLIPLNYPLKYNSMDIRPIVGNGARINVIYPAIRDKVQCMGLTWNPVNISGFQ